MQLSTQHGFAFLCMPKCASTSIEEAISQYCSINFSKHPGLKHINARNFHKYILAYHLKIVPGKEIETFCLMREPVDWIYSWYRFRTRDELKNPKHPDHANYTGNISFSQFVDELVSRKNVPYVKVGFQKDFMLLGNGEMGVDRVFPMEKMSEVEAYLSKKTGRVISIPHTNIAPKRQFDLDDFLLNQLIQYYEKDIELYNKLIESSF